MVGRRDVVGGQEGRRGARRAHHPSLRPDGRRTQPSPYDTALTRTTHTSQSKSNKLACIARPPFALPTSHRPIQNSSEAKWNVTPLPGPPRNSSISKSRAIHHFCSIGEGGVVVSSSSPSSRSSTIWIPRIALMRMIQIRQYLGCWLKKKKRGSGSAGRRRREPARAEDREEEETDQKRLTSWRRKMGVKVW